MTTGDWLWLVNTGEAAGTGWECRPIGVAPRILKTDWVEAGTLTYAQSRCLGQPCVLGPPYAEKIIIIIYLTDLPQAVRSAYLVREVAYQSHPPSLSTLRY